MQQCYHRKGKRSDKDTVQYLDEKALMNMLHPMAFEKTILITGGAGNIGGSLARKLATNQDWQVIVADNLGTGSISKMPSLNLPNFRFIKADINRYDEISAIMLAHKVNFVFHYAAVVGVSRTLENPVSVLRDIDGIKNIFELSKNTGVERVCYASSSEVYGEPVSIPQHEETTPLNSRLPYAVVKNVGESFCKSYQKEYGLPYTIFRFFNTYGPLQSEDFVLPRFLHAALHHKPIQVYGDGSQTRTFCYIDDNLATTVAAMSNDDTINETINIGSEEEISVLDLAKLIIELTNSKSSIIHLPPLAEGDMSRRFPDISKMKSILQRPPISLRDGIKKMLDQISHP